MRYDAPIPWEAGRTCVAFEKRRFDPFNPPFIHCLAPYMFIEIEKMAGFDSNPHPVS
jgi:hypothetical protein